MVRSPALGPAIERARSRWTGALIFAAAALCFAGTLRNLFVWDDWAYVVQAVGYKGFDARHLRWMFTTTRMGDYTPLAWVSYAFDYALWGMNPAGYHLTNLLLHALNAVLFYRLARVLLGRVFFNETSKNLEAGAVVAALAFALHPLRVESVAWASERRDVLAGAFYLATLLLYAKAALRRDPRGALRLRALSIACFVGAALSKATVVPLPAALLALDLYPLRRLGAGESPRERRARLIEKIPYAAVSAAAAALAVRAQAVSGNFTAMAEHGPASRLAQALYGLGFYVWKTLLPTGLCALYPIPAGRAALALPALEGVAAVAAMAWACAAAGVGRKAQAALWGYYAALLLPVLGLLQNGPQLVALRYSYLSCLGWALLAGGAAVRAVRDRGTARVRGAAILAALGVWLASNAWAAQRQIALWRDDRTLWADVLTRYPLSAYANMNVADGLLQERRPREAEAYARIATGLEPDNRTAILALARALLMQDRLPEAREGLERKLRTDPDWGEGQALLGVVLDRLGRGEEAASRLQRAAALLPGSAQTQGNAGASLALRGRYAEALPYFEAATRLDPAYAGQLDRVRRDLERSRTTSGPPR